MSETNNNENDNQNDRTDKNEKNEAWDKKQLRCIEYEYRKTERGLYIMHKIEKREPHILFNIKWATLRLEILKKQLEEEYGRSEPESEPWPV